MSKWSAVASFSWKNICNFKAPNFTHCALKMTSTRFNVGLGDSNKNSSKVLKPPGGGSSNIFGAPDVPESSLRRRNQSHLQSSVLAGADMGTPARAKPGNNSYERLFGEPEPRQPSAIKNRLKSNVPIGDQVNGKLVNGSAHNGYTQKDGNPVTGEGYIANGEKAAAPAVDGAAAAPAVNGTAAPAPAQDPAPAPAPAPTQSAGAPRRVPPGGFSSGLW